MLEYHLEQITGTLACGEALHWDNEKKCMYFVDINNCMVIRFVPETKELFQCKVEAPFVSFIIPIKGASDKFLVGIGRSVAILKWDGTSPAAKKEDLEVLCTVEDEKPKNRFNDGKCDPKGKLFAGTMGCKVGKNWEERKGAFYTLTNKKLQRLFGDVGISNGLCWSEDGKKFYYADSLTHKIDGYNYDIKNGQLSNMETVFDLKENGVPGIADGMTIDTSGNLWIALYGGSSVICVDPRTKKLIHKIPVPGQYITCVQFGGNNLDDMYVTTASLDVHSDELSISPYLGGTFIIRNLGVRGYGSVPAVL